MPKLDTTIDNLERKTNKVTGTVPSADWTDTQYPSAKTLYNAYNNLTNMINLVHPIGSVLTTSSKVNPAETLGGTWTLVDKSLKNTSKVLDSTYWTKPANSELKAEIISGTSVINITDHIISIRLNIKTKVDINDTGAELGKLLLESCGVNQTMFAVINDTTFSDEKNCVISYTFSKDGTLTITDILGLSGSNTLASGASFYIHIVQPVYQEQMLDEFCDKFYWKRTA